MSTFRFLNVLAHHQYFVLITCALEFVSLFRSETISCMSYDRSAKKLIMQHTLKQVVHYLLQKDCGDHHPYNGNAP
eukprot:762774-Hanusia_phi.AAC.3